MAVTASKNHLYLSILLSLFFISHASLNLDRSDYKAISIILKDLGFIRSQRFIPTLPCNFNGVICERRLSSNNTYFLKITRLVFPSKRLTGFLSPSIGQLTELKELSLANNNIVDQLPPQIVDCKKLEILDLQNNQFSGKIPSNVSSFTGLRILDLSSNKFSGDLRFLKYFPNLEYLSVANNIFSGKIPPLRSFRSLQFFDFSGNSLIEGPVPMMSEVESSRIQYPKRYVLAENAIRRSNNATSPAAAPRSSRTSSNAQAPGPSAAGHKHKKNNAKRAVSWILGFFAGAIAGLISGFVFSLMCKLILAAIKGGGKTPGPAIYSPLIKKAEDLAFLEKDDGLSSLQIIGKGGCGEVYKAELPGSNGKMIAVKKIIQPARDATELTDEDSKLLNKKMRQIRSEINTVGKIRHRNLIPLVAHVLRSDCHLLVYEYMKNGSLQDILTEVSRGNRELDWLTRHRIALGVASGLEYLHTNQTPRIIHRDLKPANVLLDDDMEARIADFGLAKSIPDANTHLTSSNVAGTFGYIAPEYYQTFKFTDKCDIYSFGVLLAVLVIGKFPPDEFFQRTEEMSLIKWMRRVMTSENPKEAIDSKLLGNGFEDQMLLVLKIACFCTMDNPKERPSSKEVRTMLAQIQH